MFLIIGLFLLIFSLDIHWSVTVSWFGFIGFSEALAVALLLGHTCLPASGHERFLMVIVGACSFLGQMFLTMSGKFENAGTMALLRKAFDVIFAFIFQILFFHVSYYRERFFTKHECECDFFAYVSHWTYSKFFATSRISKTLKNSWSFQKIASWRFFDFISITLPLSLPDHPIV